MSKLLESLWKLDVMVQMAFSVTETRNLLDSVFNVVKKIKKKARNIASLWFRDDVFKI